jgi:hypothetical protein
MKMPHRMGTGDERTDGGAVDRRRGRTRFVRFAALALAFGLVGCGTATSPPIATSGVTVAPAGVTLYTLGSQTFTASVADISNQSVNWSVQEGANGGTITSAGVYTAPAVLGTFHVVATSASDATKIGTAAVTVTVLPVGRPIAISPAAAVLSIGSGVTFTATINGGSSQGVTWTVQEGAAGGTISSSGAYAAPNTPGTFHVVATSIADQTISGTATVVVQSGGSAVTVN